jgi:ABC-type Fe3+-citrate transport system substrate-binding protein
MDNDLRLEIFNTPELAAMFDEMTLDLQHKVIAAGLRKSAKIVLEETEKNLYKATDSAAKIAKALGTKVPNGELAIMLGARKKGMGNLAHLFEDGTVQRFYTARKAAKQMNIRKGDRHATGKMTATHFFADAIESTQPEVMETLYKNVNDAMLKLIRKYNKVNK